MGPHYDQVVITYTRQSGVKWNLVEFGGKTGSESRGIVDLVAIRKDYKPHQRGLKQGDLFDIILIQVKGGGRSSHHFSVAHLALFIFGMVQSFQNIVTNAIYSYNLSVHGAAPLRLFWCGNHNFSRLPMDFFPR